MHVSLAVEHEEEELSASHVRWNFGFEAEDWVELQPLMSDCENMLCAHRQEELDCWDSFFFFFSPCTPEGHGAAAPLIWMFNYDNSSAASSIGLWGNVTQTPGCYKSSRCAALCLNLHIIHFTSTVSRIRIISSFHRADVKTNSPHHLTLIGM